MYTKNTQSRENQEQQALEQIRAIIETLGPDSYITSALQNTFGDALEAPSDPNLTDELQQIRLPEKTVQEWDTASQIAKRICSSNGGLPPMIKRQRYYDSLKEAA